MTTCNNLAELEAKILEAVQIALDRNVAPVVKESIQTAVSTEVYGAGDPLWYDRRRLRNGSLGDTEMMHHEVAGNTLIVTDNAESSRPWESENTFAESIHYGYAGKDTWYSQSRPFMDEAKKILEEDRVHVLSLADGLREMGFEVI